MEEKIKQLTRRGVLSIQDNCEFYTGELALFRMTPDEIPQVIAMQSKSLDELLDALCETTP